MQLKSRYRVAVNTTVLDRFLKPLRSSIYQLIGRTLIGL